MRLFRDFVKTRTLKSTPGPADRYYLYDDAGNASAAITEAQRKAIDTSQYAPLAYARNGSGAPNGVVVGSVGDRYVDTAATLGARIWYKATGAATNTGWLVAEGDTGPRNIASILLNSWTGNNPFFPIVRRIGNTCSFEGSFTNVSATSAAIYTLPVGFRVNSGGFAVPNTLLINRSGGAHLPMSYSGAGDLLPLATSVAGHVYGGSFFWTTQDAWPTSLPGTAA